MKFNRTFCVLLKEDKTTKMRRADRRGDLYIMNLTTYSKDEKMCLVASTSEEAGSGITGSVT